VSTRLEDYDYHLPPELVATRPAARRGDSRMLVLDRSTGAMEHRMFRDFADHLHPGDLVVLNDSKVIKARLLSQSPPMEVFLLEQLGASRWKCLVRPGRKFRPGAAVPIAGTVARVEEILQDGARVVCFDEPPDLATHGTIPLPPYMRRDADRTDEVRYQTVYAKHGGSVAAPTAGLHFTEEILHGIPHAFLTLHVGAGTFLPVKGESVDDHTMHEESYEIPPETAEAINAATRTVAVGTTVARVLESMPPGPLAPVSGRTSIFIKPPHHFAHTGALLTNFHLPRSTLLMLVSAFAGRGTILAAYREAVHEGYRFYSYGDCMLIL
jgi:S-adenosylmethionine:tRNA ribosyltransferase-isomerase